MSCSPIVNLLAPWRTAGSNQSQRRKCPSSSVGSQYSPTLREELTTWIGRWASFFWLGGFIAQESNWLSIATLSSNLEFWLLKHWTVEGPSLIPRLLPMQKNREEAEYEARRSCKQCFLYERNRPCSKYMYTFCQTWICFVYHGTISKSDCSFNIMGRALRPVLIAYSM